MSRKVYYIGSQGPFICYPDRNLPGDASRKQYPLSTEHQLNVETAPEEDTEVIRKVDVDELFRLIAVADIDNPTELSSYGGNDGTTIVAYEEDAPDQHTIYVLDVGGTALVNPPYLVEGNNGLWVAVAGKYIAQQAYFNAGLLIGSVGALYLNTSSYYINTDSNELQFTDPTTGSIKLSDLYNSPLYWSGTDAETGEGLVGLKLVRGAYTLYFKVNSSYNGLTLDHFDGP